MRGNEWTKMKQLFYIRNGRANFYKIKFNILQTIHLSMTLSSLSYPWFYQSYLISTWLILGKFIRVFDSEPGLSLLKKLWNLYTRLFFAFTNTGWIFFFGAGFLFFIILLLLYFVKLSLVYFWLLTFFHTLRIFENMEKLNISIYFNLLILYRTTEDVYHSTEDVYRTAEDVYRTTEDVYRTAEDVYRATVDMYRGAVGMYHWTEDVYRGAEDVYPGAEDVFHGVVMIA